MPCSETYLSSTITNGPSCNFTTPSFATTVSESSTMETSTFNRYGAVTSLVIIMVVSVVLNGLVIVTMLQRKVMLKSNHSLLVLNMALSGFGLSVICEPITLLSLIDEGTAVKESTALCMINGFTSTMFPLLTTLLLSLVSIDRYLVICKPHADVLSRLRLKIILAVVWLFSALYGLPPLVGWSKYEYHQGTFHCSPDWTVLSYRLTCIFLGLAVPSTAILYCYTAIFKFVRQNHRKLKAWRDKGTEVRGSATLQTAVEPSKRLSIPRKFLRGNATAPLDETVAATEKTSVGLHKDHDIECQLSSCHSQDAVQVDPAKDTAKQQQGTTSVEQHDSDRPSNLNTDKEELSPQTSGNINSSPMLRHKKKPHESQAFLTIVKSNRHGSFDQIRGESSQLRAEPSEFVTEGITGLSVFTTQTSRDTHLVPDGRRRVLDNLETSQKKDRKDRENHKIQRKIALSAVIYIGSHFACWGPYVFIVGGGGYGLPLWVQTLVMWLAYSSSIVCPVVYALNNRKILQEVRRVCPCVKRS
ncbi:OPN1LW [Branchiostoma lanceolatum]|uniref:OPN1LW protein n=1 Tax=Branchiostoma lanceolatum TaxID=7740 RepID=A0A8J9Z7M9_BRALA|nr:OPN1LW [Branchiostoma lanceolatum]